MKTLIYSVCTPVGWLSKNKSYRLHTEGAALSVCCHNGRLSLNQYFRTMIAKVLYIDYWKKRIQEMQYFYINVSEGWYPCIMVFHVGFSFLNFPKPSQLRALDSSPLLSIKQSTHFSPSLCFVPTLKHRNPKISPLRDLRTLRNNKFQFEKVLSWNISSVCLLTLRLGCRKEKQAKLVIVQHRDEHLYRAFVVRLYRAT